MALRGFTSAAELREFYRDLHARTRAWAPPTPPSEPEPTSRGGCPVSTGGSDIPSPKAEPEPEPLLQEQLPPLPLPFVRRTPLVRIVCATCAEFELSAEEVRSQRRTTRVVIVRQVIALLARELTNNSSPQIGKALGGRDHSTILYAVIRMRQRLLSDSDLAQRVERLRTKLLLDEE